MHQNEKKEVLLELDTPALIHYPRKVDKCSRPQPRRFYSSAQDLQVFPAISHLMFLFHSRRQYFQKLN